jgi:hypothetical protein
MPDEPRGEQTWWVRHLEERIKRLETDRDQLRDALNTEIRAGDKRIARLDEHDRAFERVEGWQREHDRKLEQLVTKEDFKPVKTGLWGIVSAVLLTIVAGILKLLMPGVK